jgi:hypothetical protein
MKTRIFLLLLLAALLLLSTGGVTGSAPPRYRLETGPLARGNVEFTSVSLADVDLTGGAYRLAIRSASGSATGSAGSGCCCSWLPCVLNQK